MPERAALRQAVLAEIREAASCASGDDERCEKCNRHVDAVLAAIARRRPQDGDCPVEDVFAHRPCTLKRGHEGYHDFAGQVAASETPAPELPLAALLADRHQLREALRRIALGAGDPSVAADAALMASREYREQWEVLECEPQPAPELAAGSAPSDVRPRADGRRGLDVTCGSCGEDYGTNVPDADEIECPECEAHRCPCCLAWFGGGR
jgi:hypothetical protein